MDTWPSELTQAFAARCLPGPGPPTRRPAPTSTWRRRQPPTWLRRLVLEGQDELARRVTRAEGSVVSDAGRARSGPRRGRSGAQEQLRVLLVVVDAEAVVVACDQPAAGERAQRLGAPASSDPTPGPGRSACPAAVPSRRRTCARVGLRQAVVDAVVLDRARLAVVLREDHGAALLVGRDLPPHARRRRPRTPASRSAPPPPRSARAPARSRWAAAAATRRTATPRRRSPPTTVTPSPPATRRAGGTTATRLHPHRDQHSNNGAT